MLGAQCLVPYAGLAPSDDLVGWKARDLTYLYLAIRALDPDAIVPTLISYQPRLGQFICTEIAGMQAGDRVLDDLFR